jgi:DNA repair exonuclease SbcCD ATPase subunit
MSNPITLDDVRDAYDQLVADGITPSNAKVRAVIGRGSMTTITKHVATIRAEREDQDADLPGPVPLDDVPAEMLAALAEPAQRAALELYRSVAGPINERIALARQEHEQQQQALRDELDQVLADAGDYQERAEAAETALQDARDTITRLTEQLAQRTDAAERYQAEASQLAQEAAALKERADALSDAEQRAAERADQAAERVAVLSRERDAALSELDKSEAAKAESERRWVEERAELKSQAASDRAEAAAAKRLVDEIDSRMNKTLEYERQQTGKVTVALDRANERVGELREALAAAKVTQPKTPKPKTRRQTAARKSADPE